MKFFLLYKIYDNLPVPYPPQYLRFCVIGGDLAMNMMMKMQSVVVCAFQSVIVKKEKKSPFHQMRTLTLTLTLKVTPIRPRFAELLSLRTLSSSSSLDYSDQSRGGLPRFFSELLPPSKAPLSLKICLQCVQLLCFCCEMVLCC